VCVCVFVINPSVPRGTAGAKGSSVHQMISVQSVGKSSVSSGTAARKYGRNYGDNGDVNCDCACASD
jgi:hypothetical protein